MTNLLLASLLLLAILTAVLLVRLAGRDRGVDRNRELLLFEKGQERTERSIREEFARSRDESLRSVQRSREELGAALKSAGDTQHRQLASLMQTNDLRLERVREAVETRLAAFGEGLDRLTASNELKLDTLRTAMEDRLKALQEDNAKQLDLMRATVDEKLQGTLEKRLGDSFRLVSERLEQVHKGLGEMQTLAAGVGDLKKVLTNVKTRGTWGEVQLSLLLEQVLTPEQYAANVATKGGSERVEFAIRLPGRGDDGDDVVWLPIDAKFPVEDYQRMLEAPDPETAEVSARQLEIRIRQCAKDIRDKYLDPPHTTDFGILFLPTEGLFAEVMRRTGLPDQIQRDFRVVIAGPATLWSILNSLQMGFRTLTIQKRSSEVWNLLAAVKTEWTTYGEVLDKVQRQLHQATDTLDKARVRTRAIGRRLKGVQELPPGEAHAVLAMGREIERDEEEGDIA